MASYRLREILLCWVIVCSALLCTCLSACQTTKRVVLRVDGQERIIETSAGTVRDVLREAGVSLGEWDRVEPSLWVEIPRSITITVIRVQEQTKHQDIPFTYQVVKDEALPEGEIRLLQTGKKGTLELTYRVSYNGPQELDRQLLGQRVITEARPEILAAGAGGGPEAVPITGTIAYLSNGNAWIMRRNSAEKRPVTFSGDLDGRVFDLAENGQNLLYTRLVLSSVVSPTNTSPPFNELWALDTRILQEEPKPLGITNVIYAEWSSDGQFIAYSTADSTPGSPGWRAHNDIWVLNLDSLTKTQVLRPSSDRPYDWWGRRYAWNPDSRRFAYATADTIGIVDMATGQLSPLLRFPVFHTYSEWVWIPKIAWSPEGRYLACVVHNISPRAIKAEDSPIFDLWILDARGDIRTPLLEQVGMWADPAWSSVWSDSYGVSHVEIACTVAQIPSYSQHSFYDLYVMDRDGSNKTKVLPQQGELGASNVEMAWSPFGRQLVCIWQKRLYLVSLDQSKAWPLTSGAACEQVEWEGQ